VQILQFFLRFGVAVLAIFQVKPIIALLKRNIIPKKGRSNIRSHNETIFIGETGTSSAASAEDGFGAILFICESKLFKWEPVLLRQGYGGHKIF
jgi:hypothetical protein